MANVVINDSHLTAIGNAIRTKNGSQILYKPREMAAAIEAIEVGGGGGSGDGEISAVHQSMIDITSYSGNTGGMKIVLPKEATHIPPYLFYQRNGLSEVEFENHSAPNFTYIGKYAFYQSNYLRKFEFPESTQVIHDSAFRYCWALDFDHWPSSLVEIQANAFRGCYEGMTIDHWPATVPVVDQYVLAECTRCQITSLPEGVTYIGNYAFSEACDTSETRELFTIPSTVDNVGNFAFKGQNFKKIRFMGTPSYISTSAFSNSDVTDMYVPWTHSGAIANSPFGAINATIHYNVGPEDVIE